MQTVARKLTWFSIDGSVKVCQGCSKHALYRITTQFAEVRLCWDLGRSNLALSSSRYPWYPWPGFADQVSSNLRPWFFRRGKLLQSISRESASYIEQQSLCGLQCSPIWSICSVVCRAQVTESHQSSRPWASDPEVTAAWHKLCVADLTVYSDTVSTGSNLKILTFYNMVLTACHSRANFSNLSGIKVGNIIDNL